MNLQDKRVMVLGANGFLGKNLREPLRRKADNIVYPMHRHYDLRRREAVRKLFQNYEPEVVINLAASLGGIEANAANPGKFFYDNITMGAEIMEACREFGVEKLVNMGTSCSYPANSPSPVKEEYLGQGKPNETTGYYGMAKLALITMAKGYREQYGLNVITLIPANIYGPYDSFDPRRSHVIPALITKCIEAKKTSTDLVVWGSGAATREFIYAKDCAEAIVMATESYDKPEPVNLGTGKETSMLALACHIAAAVGHEGGIVTDSSKPEGQRSRVFDVSRAEKEFGFRATTSLVDGIKLTLDWYNEDSNRSS